MDNVKFNPEITLSTGTSGPVTFNVRQIIEFGPHPIAGTTVHTQPTAGGFFFTDKTHVSESPEEIAKAILRAVHAWRYDALEPDSGQKEQNSVPNPRGQEPGPQQNVYKEAQKSFAESEMERIDGIISDHYDAAKCPGDYNGTITDDVLRRGLQKIADDEKRRTRPLEIPGKDAVRASRISAEEFAQGLEKLRGGPEAGDDRVKYAEGTGTVSMGKLREALGALQHPGAQIVAKGMAATKFGGPMPPVGKCSFCGGAHLSEDHTALGSLGYTVPDRLEAQAATLELPKDPVGVGPDRLRGALAKFADSLNSAIPNRPDKQLSLADLEEYIIKTLEDPGSALTLQTGGQAIRQGRPVYLSPELRINFPPDRGH